jgi:hypothetical protein
VKERSVTLLDLLDRILATGVMAHGDLTLSVAGVDLIYLGLRALLTSADRAEELQLLPPRSPDDTPPLPPAELPPIQVEARRAASDVDLADLAEQVADRAAKLPARLDADPENVERGLAKLVLTLIELLRQLMERQAMRRVEAGTLTDAEIERLGVTFLRLQQRMEELKAAFGLEGEDLNLNLGPLGDLM